VGLLDDFRRVLRGGDNQRVVPFQRKAPTTKKFIRTGAALGAEQTGIPSLERVVTGRASAGDYLSAAGPAAAALPLRQLKRAPQLAKLNRAADEAQLVGPPKLLEAFDQFPKYTRGMKTRKGRTYQVDMGPARAQTSPEELRRRVLVQDPKTGTIYVAPGGFHHAELESQLGAMGVRSDGWMQHELFPSAGEGVPARLNQRVWDEPWMSNQAFGVPGARDTRAATIARMRLLRNLQQLGVRMAPPAQNMGRW
jgi:hypothetical protein